MSANDAIQLPRYEYEPLRPDALRLIKLRLATASQSDIDCELVQAKLIDPDTIDSEVTKKENQQREDNDSQIDGNNKEDGTRKGRDKDNEAKSKGQQQENLDLIEYEALSWCWGNELFDRTIRIHKGDEAFLFRISKNLELALRALRKEDGPRWLWVDQICIHQINIRERNEQVPKMNRIYGQAKNVCIWVGEEKDNSSMAIDFIQSRVLRLWEFDELCENLKVAEQWLALVMLMKRSWFSRRWVVQEIALANKATLHCGRKQIDWQDFADAVSLFVQVESATHRLSEVMRRAETFHHVHDFFGNVPVLGAALLVEATTNLFRDSKAGKKEPLLSLEYLVSKYSVFEATQPRDTIYSFLAIASDTKPHSAEREAAPKLVSKWIQGKFKSEAYPVDYRLPVIEVYKDFIEFSIRKSEKVRALDIICRPWARRVKKSEDQMGLTDEQIRVSTSLKRNNVQQEEEDDEADEFDPLPSWIPDLNGAASIMRDHPSAGKRMERKNADPLVGLPGSEQRRYRAAGSKEVASEKLRFKKWKNDYSMFVEGFVLDNVGKVEEPARRGNIPWTWLAPGGWYNTRKDPPSEFWRTLVANRGPDGNNPRSFFKRACREIIKKSPEGDTVDTNNLITEGRCTIVAEFLRRVQAVIWNRRLMRTRAGHLGLVHENAKEGDFICILYGCSVPVVLRKVIKTAEDMAKEAVEDEEERLKRLEEPVRFLQKMYRKRLYRRATLNLLGGNERKETQNIARIDSEVNQNPDKSLNVMKDNEVDLEESKSSDAPESERMSLERHQTSNTTESEVVSLDHGKVSDSKVNGMLVNQKTDMPEHSEPDAGSRQRAMAPRIKFWAFFNYARLVWLVVVFLHVNIKLHLPTEVALLANSSMLISPLIFMKLQSTPCSEAETFKIEKHQWPKYAGPIWWLLVSIHIARWRQVTFDTLLVCGGFVVLFPEILLLTSSEIRLLQFAQPHWGGLPFIWKSFSAKHQSSEPKGAIKSPTMMRAVQTTSPTQRTKAVQTTESSQVTKQNQAKKLPSTTERQRHYWKLLGECYVHDMMEGQAIAFQNEAKVRSEIFELR